MHIQEEKAILRKTMKQRLASHQQFPKSKQQEAASLDTMQQQEASAIQLLFQEPQYQHADSILAYAALPGELSVDQLIQQALDEGKKVFLPKSYPDNCSMEFYQLENHLPYTQQVVCGSYGIRTEKNTRSPKKLWCLFQDLPLPELGSGSVGERAFTTDFWLVFLQMIATLWECAINGKLWNEFLPKQQTYSLIFF